MDRARGRELTASLAGLELFAVGDQIRKGAALNAIQIAEVLLRGRPASASE